MIKVTLFVIMNFLISISVFAECGKVQQLEATSSNQAHNSIGSDSFVNTINFLPENNTTAANITIPGITENNLLLAALLNHKTICLEALKTNSGQLNGKYKVTIYSWK
ncbi:MAG: hypothetical protein QE271_07840 [Bacteriovoracaceae bacterium]|nr:hypothetical protein [Bacteriovoracaceae bacterium]